MIRLLLLLLAVILYLIFMVYNQEERVVLKYAMSLSTQPLPIPTIILGAVLVGLVLGAVLALPAWFRLRSHIKRQSRTISQMDQELNRLTSDPSEGRVDSPGHPGEPREI